VAAVTRFSADQIRGRNFSRKALANLAASEAQPAIVSD
jgi:hypothetical protein